MLKEFLMTTLYALIVCRRIVTPQFCTDLVRSAAHIVIDDISINPTDA